MNLKFESNSQPITEHELRKFEQQINMSLPSDYRNFLLQNNGGYLKQRYWYVNATWQAPNSHLNEKLAVTSLYNLNEKHEHSVQRYLNDLDVYIPHAMIPIGDTVSPILIMALAGEKRGSIFVWLPDSNIDHDQTDPEQLGLVATSFTEFMEKLYFVADNF